MHADTPRINAAVRARRGFTLLELTLVVVIITLLVAGSVLALGGVAGRNRVRITGSTLSQVKTALEDYNINKGYYPQTLDELIAPQGVLERAPKDAWSEPLYFAPIAVGPAQPFELYSAGPDRIPGTEDDISVWALDDL